MASHGENAGTDSGRPGMGGNGVSVSGRKRVEEIQRVRILAAMVKVVGERGLTGATVANVVARAGVSRRTFYELFDDRDGCFLATLDYAVARASDHVLPAYESGDRWTERLRLGLAALLSFLDLEPGLGHLLVVGSLGAGPKVMEHRSWVLAEIITIVDGGRDQSKAAIALPSLTAEGVVGAAFAVIHARMVTGEKCRLLELLNPLMSMIVLPYLGPAAARRELARPVSKSGPRKQIPIRDPLEDLNMRLTYRTVRALAAIGAYPGASNKEVGGAAGARDQGQVSKLLSRLERLGLIHNDGIGPTRGEPNAWLLTARGQGVLRALEGQLDE